MHSAWMHKLPVVNVLTFLRGCNRGDITLVLLTGYRQCEWDGAQTTPACPRVRRKSGSLTLTAAEQDFGNTQPSPSGPVLMALGNDFYRCNVSLLVVSYDPSC